jgi:DNA-binding beta-propeller fold protein YncE
MNKNVIKIISLCLSLILLSACTITDKETHRKDTAKSHKTEITTFNPDTTETTYTDMNSIDLNKSDKSKEMKEMVKMNSVNVWEEFCSIGSDVCAGILFDKEGNMLVARQLGIDKVTPEGTVTTFCDFSGLEKRKDYYFKSPFIWDMKYDNDNNIIAAAQDRIIKITEDGNVTTLIREDFSGFLGASGLEIDKEGNIYVVNGGKVYKYSKELNKSEYLSSSDYRSFFSIAFSPDSKFLYLTDFYTKTLIKYEINPDGSVGKGTEIVREPVENSGDYGAPMNMIFNDNGNMYVSLDGMAQILRVDQNDNLTLIDMNEPVRNHIIAFGNNKFGEDLLYFTTYSDKVCKIQLGEDNELR